MWSPRSPIKGGRGAQGAGLTAPQDICRAPGPREVALKDTGTGQPSRQGAGWPPTMDRGRPAPTRNGGLQVCPGQHAWAVSTPQQVTEAPHETRSTPSKTLATQGDDASYGMTTRGSKKPNRKLYLKGKSGKFFHKFFLPKEESKP